MSSIERARAFATRAHGKQRYGNAPYTVHLERVLAVLNRAGVTDEAVLMAGLLHDTIEDTSVTRADLVAEFGEAVAAMVDAVSDGEGNTRAERKVRPYGLIPNTPGAVVVKLADRIANVSAALETEAARHLKRYVGEAEAFRRVLHRPGQADILWRELEGLMALARSHLERQR